MRRALGRDKVHMEHLIAGPYQKRGGPARAVLSEAGVDEKRLTQIILDSLGTTPLAESTYNLSTPDSRPGADAGRWAELLEKLATLQPHVEDQPCDGFVEWAPKVARYSFQSGRVLLTQSVAGPSG